MKALCKTMLAVPVILGLGLTVKYYSSKQTSVSQTVDQEMALTASQATQQHDTAPPSLGIQRQPASTTAQGPGVNPTSIPVPAPAHLDLKTIHRSNASGNFSSHSETTVETTEAKSKDDNKPAYPPVFSKSKKVQISFTQLIDRNGNALKVEKVEHEDQSQDLMLPLGSYLTVEADNSCLLSVQDKNQQSLSAELASRSDLLQSLAIQTYEYELQQETLLSELEEAVNEDDCILGLSHNGQSYSSFTPNDPYLSGQRFHHLISSYSGWDTLHKTETRVQKTIRVAVIDTGVDYTHPDLQNRMVRDASGNVMGYDFYYRTKLELPQHPHGTHVAGLIAAQGNNGIGGTGVMWKRARIMPLVACHASGVCWSPAIANGIRFAADNGAEIINISLGGPGANPTVESALVYAINKGVTIFVSAGNDSSQMNDPGNFYSPASYGAKYKGVLAVASVDASNRHLSSFSNYGNEVVEIAAPGSDQGLGGMMSTMPVAQGSYGKMQGTSMASPVAAAAGTLVVSWMKTHNYPYTPAIVENILRRGSVNEAILTPYVKNGKRIDLKILADYLQANYPAR